jgi:hypothetical protein
MKTHFQWIASCFFLLIACTATSTTSNPNLQLPTLTPTPPPQPTDIWAALQTRDTVAYSTPLPPEEVTPIDGSYALYDAGHPQWWACLRCPDYRPAGGIWKLRFDRGVMRIYYAITGWHSLASYTVEGDHLTLFNDPYCPQEVGEYRWRLEDRWGLAERVLVLELVSDPCSIELRGQNLSRATWFSCAPPNLMTGASDHYHREPGCEDFDARAWLIDAPTPPTNLTVMTYSLNSKHFKLKPDVFVDANPSGELPEGVILSYSDISIPYGLNRVLWGIGDWVELTVEREVSAIGVQIYGKHTMGWARVLFDGVEVWRGDTLALGEEYSYYGGYVEVSGFKPGVHTLRVESIGLDYRPVTIAHFGLSETGTVVP